MNAFTMIVRVSVLSLLTMSVNSYSPIFLTKRSAMTMRKGRKSLKKTIEGDLGGSKSSGVRTTVGDTTKRKNRWVPVGVLSTIDLPKDDGKVNLIETNAKQLMNAQVNPNGAVAVAKYEGKTYCFSSSCSICKIPLTKAKIMPPTEETDNLDPRIACNFCTATFNMKTGKRISDAGGPGGIFGGVVRNLFGSMKSEDLPTYDLGEKDGTLLIDLS